VNTYSEVLKGIIHKAG